MKFMKPFLLFFSLLAMAALACGPNLPDVPEGAVETVQSAGEQAGNAAETAVALATQEGAAALETLQAVEVPDLGAFGDKFESIQPDANGNFTVTITDTELNQAIQQSQQSSGTAENSNLQNIVFTFTGGNIVLTGSVTSPIEAQLTVTFRPSVANGTIQFEVVSATLGSVQVPAAILTTAEGTLNSTLGQAINNLPSNLTLQSIVVGEGTMTISGTRN